MAEELDVEALLEAPFANSSSSSLSTSTSAAPTDGGSSSIKSPSRSEAGNDNTNGKVNGNHEKSEKEDSGRHSERSRRSDSDRHRSSRRRSRERDDDRRSSRRKRSRSRSYSRSRSRSPRSRSRSPRRHHDGRSRYKDYRDRHHHHHHRGGRYYDRKERDHRGGRDYDDRSEREKEREKKRKQREEDEAKLTPEERQAAELERDLRTVFSQNLPLRASEDDIMDFFSKVGKVRDVRLITDRNSRKSKGIGYIEFFEPESVGAALGLSGTQWMGQTITVQPTQAEKNRVASNASTPAGPTRLYVGSLQFNVTEEDLRSHFAPYGDIEFIDLHKDPETGRSKGFAFIQYRRPEEAKKALSQASGLIIAGRQIKIGFVNENKGQTASALVGSAAGAHGELDDEEGGVTLKAADRAILMAKLQRGQELIPGAPIPMFPQTAVAAVPPGPCILLKNMFDPAVEEDPDFHLDIRNDVADECAKYGPLKHIFVDKDSQGFVYIKFQTTEAADAAAQALRGRWFAGKMISAEFVPVDFYHTRFPESR